MNVEAVIGDIQVHALLAAYKHSAKLPSQLSAVQLEAGLAVLEGICTPCNLIIGHLKGLSVWQFCG